MSIIYGGAYTRKAIKPHWCEECGHKIPPGEAYHLWEGATDDSDGPYTWKAHLTCYHAAVLLNDISGWEDPDEPAALGKIVDILSEYPEFKPVLRRAYPSVALRLARNRQAADAKWQAHVDEVHARNRLRLGITTKPGPLIEAAQEILRLKSSTFKARNGRDVGIEGDDGEKVWLVHSDQIHALEYALMDASK